MNNSYKIVELTCGLGNQMFQYAFAKALQKHLEIPILLDKTWYKDDLAVQFGLDIFPIDLEYATQDQIDKAKRRTKIPGFLRKMFGIRKHKIAYSGAFDFHEEYLKPNDFLYFSGFFQNPLYLNGMFHDLRACFTPKHFSDSYYERLEKIQKADNSVCIHLRRGDYCKLSWELGMEYYKKAIAYILEHVKEPQFFVFGATDREFIKRCNFGISFEDLSETEIILANQHEDMFLMSACKHAIVANSSYSFWAAQLSYRDDKIIIAPSPWLLDNDSIIPEKWIKIPANTKGEV